MVKDILLGFEDSVGEPVVAHELPEVLDGIEFGRFWRQRDEGNVVGDFQGVGKVPAGLIDDDNGMSARRDGGGDFYKVQGHGRRIAHGQHQGGADAARRTDRSKDPGRAGPLVERRRWPRAALGPTPGDLVFLTDAGLVLPPDFYGRARREPLFDLRHRGGELFLNPSRAFVSWVWWRGRVDSLA